MLNEINIYIKLSSTLPSCQRKIFLSRYQKGIDNRKQNKERYADFTILVFGLIFLKEILKK